MGRRRLTWLSVLVLAAILAAGTIATFAAVRHERDSAASQRAEAAAPVVRALAGEVVSTAESLDAVRAFFESSDAVSSADLTRFAAPLLRRHPALEYLAWSPLEADGRPRTALVVRRGAVTIPVDGALATPETRRAMAAARDAAVPRMTPPLMAPDGQRVVVMVAPVYASGAPLGGVAQRRAALRGYVTGGSLVAELGRPAEERLPEGASIDVRDEDTAVLGGGGGRPAGTIEAGGRRWTVAIAGLPGPSATLPLSIGATGLLLTALVGLMLVSSAGREASALDELERLRTRHDLILGSAGDGIIGLDRDCRAGFVNPAAARMLGWDVEDLTGGRVDELVLPALGEPVRAGHGTAGEAQMRRRDGSTFPAEYTVTPMDERGGPRGAVLVFRDVTERKRAEARTLESLALAEERAAVDPLTGLANHRTFHDRLRDEIRRAGRHGRGLALVLMDLDHFKRVNDEYGHQVGDLVLQHAAHVLTAETRSGELVARVGGEEFAMLLPEADGDEAFRAAERVRRGVAAARFPAVGTMTMSAGVCELSHAEDADALYRLADSALYAAKSAGRDTVRRYRPPATGG